MKNLFSLLFCFIVSSICIGQNIISGTVNSTDAGPLIGASILVKGTTIGTTADLDGNFSLEVPVDKQVLVFSFLGYTSQEIELNGRKEIIITLKPDKTTLNEVVVLGSRSKGRTKLSSPVAVDLLDVKEIAGNSAQTTVNAIMNYVAPSFSSNTQTIVDGMDHIDPASLRGLGPDQVLVLVNGKRRHCSSLVNVNGAFGRGSVGTDLNAIPVHAIERIEVLRDGASALYGSDAIAGVINIVLKDDIGLTANVGTGANVTKNAQDGMDGESLQMAVNYGVPIGEKGGVLNFTGVYDNRNYTSRMKSFSGKIFADYNNPEKYPNPTGKDITEEELVRRGLDRSDFNMRLGQSAIQNGGVFTNVEIPLDETSSFYAFGGLNYRHGESAGFYRLPYQERTVTDLYPNGFLPEIHSTIKDNSAGVGIRGKARNWDVDLSNTLGTNSFNFQIENSANASMETNSPTSFNSGGFSFLQNTGNLDLRRKFGSVLEGLNIAFGSEFRIENYRIYAGEENSYRNYGLASEYVTSGGDTILIPDPEGSVNTVFGPNGKARPGGAQVFPGFEPKNEVNKYRTSAAGYIDAELDITKQFLITGALRLENYSDFGRTLNGKFATRYKLTEFVSARGSASTGFRAPSLHQLYFNNTYTLFPYEVGTFPNNSRPAKLLGIPKLKEEKSFNGTIGITAAIKKLGLNFTLDGYIVDINDRVVLTGQFTGDPNGSTQDKEISEILTKAGASRAAFFANAIDTRTKGIEFVTTLLRPVGTGDLRISFASSISRTTLGKVHTSDLLKGKEDVYFDRMSRIFLESAVPNTKMNLTLQYNIGKFSFILRNVYFGKVQEATNKTEVENEDGSKRIPDDIYSPKIITDLSVGISLTKDIKLSIGSNNILDIYPDYPDPAFQEDGRFIFSRRSTQFGMNGRYIFSKIFFKL